MVEGKYAGEVVRIINNMQQILDGFKGNRYRIFMSLRETEREGESVCF